MTLLENYERLKNHYLDLHAAASKTGNIVAAFRLITILLWAYSSYHFYKTEQTAWLLGTSLFFFALFLTLVSLHLKYKEKTQLYTSLVKINEHEMTYLKGHLSPFKTGNAYIEPNHPYTYDLDIFGEGSIFQHINRTTTAIGEAQLAQWLKNTEGVTIQAQQEAVRELGLKLDWRQHYLAAGQLNIDEDLSIPKFKQWLDAPLNYQLATFLKILSYVLPLLTIGILVANFLSDDPVFFTVLKILFFVNLGVVASQQKNIKEEHRLLNNTDNVLKKYGNLLQHIENEPFTCDLLRGIVMHNVSTSKAAGSVSIKRLSKILNQFDSILNPIAALVMNGLFQYHLHAMFTLEKWKIHNKDVVFKWFESIGTFEALSSMANFAYNNPDFIFPEITDEPKLVLKNVGHPLIPLKNRICNDVSFDETKFIVLTGSNMSGKSTFLRTLGVNLVLANMGAPVCAERFVFYPFNVFVSMRVSDSLQNSESFFFAELKRLKSIIEELDKPTKMFIILDEILRGTNSNDKRAGTQGLIRNLIAKEAIGIIATHDLIISEMKDQHPQYLANKCFEAEITNDELHFDYQLRDGVCQQMSAAFLMRKMEII